jgi:hypothetical protein
LVSGDIARQLIPEQLIKNAIAVENKMEKSPKCGIGLE